MALYRIAVLVLLVCSLCRTTQANANVLQGVRFGKHGPQSRVVFDLQQQASYRLESTGDPLTIRVVFSGLSLAPNLEIVRARDGLIQEVRLRSSASEVVGDIILKQAGTVQREAQIGAPSRVVLDIAQRKDKQPRGEGEQETGRQRDSAKAQRAVPVPPQQNTPVAAPRTPAESTPGAALVPPSTPPSHTPQAASTPATALTPAQLLERAEQQWAAQQIEAAQRSYTMFLQRYPEHPNNHVIAARLADILRARGHHREALDAYTAVLQGYPGKDGALISQIRLAELGSTMPDLLPPGDEPRYASYRHPLQTLQRLTQAFPFSPLAEVARFKMGEILARQHDLTAALEMFQQLLRRPLQDALRRDVQTSLRQTLGQLLAHYQQQGAFLQVLQTFFVYKSFLSPAETGHPDMLYPVVLSYAQLGLLDEAQSLLPKLREATALQPPMALTLAQPFAQRARHEVVSALLNPLEQFTDPALRRQALLLLTESAGPAPGTDNLERYGQMGEELLTSPAERTKFLALLGQTYESKGKPLQALQAFRRCAEVPEAGDMAETCLLRAAALHTAQGQHQAALALYEHVLHRFPNSSGTPGLLFRMAESHRQQTDPAQMRTTFIRLRETTQDAFWQKVATEYLEQAQWQERLHERLAVFQNTLMR